MQIDRTLRLAFKKEDKSHLKYSNHAYDGGITVFKDPRKTYFMTSLISTLHVRHLPAKMIGKENVLS